MDAVPVGVDVIADAFDPAPPTPTSIASICRCPTPQEHASRAAGRSNETASWHEERNLKMIAELKEEMARQRTSTTNYTIERVTRVGDHLVMQVRYPNCEHRAFEGLKTMVFLNVTETQALRWKSIDPHFRGPNRTQEAIAKKQALLLDEHRREQTEAPSPAARFPGDEAGWMDALTYARGKD